MKNKARCIELRTSEGKVILSLYLCDKEVSLKDSQEDSGEKRMTNPKKKTASSPSDDQMTDAQKRYLFRLLAGNGIDGEKAHEYLKDLFQVESLKEVTKLEASKIIEQLLEETKGGQHDRVPF